MKSKPKKKKKKLIRPISTACRWQWRRDQAAMGRKTGGGEGRADQ